jgi:hypothetical protein
MLFRAQVQANPGFCRGYPVSEWPLLLFVAHPYAHWVFSISYCRDVEHAVRVIEDKREEARALGDEIAVAWLNGLSPTLVVQPEESVVLNPV